MGLHALTFANAVAGSQQNAMDSMGEEERTFLNLCTGISLVTLKTASGLRVLRTTAGPRTNVAWSLHGAEGCGELASIINASIIQIKLFCVGLYELETIAAKVAKVPGFKVSKFQGFKEKPRGVRFFETLKL
jgi:hypothetical protein